MADELAWPIEIIPDGNSVFMRAHKAHFRDGVLQPGVFREQDGGMSVDWDKYGSAETTRQQAPKPADNGVLSMPVAGIRHIEGLKVEHTPEPLNRAHAEVFGLGLTDRERQTEMRLLLLGISQILIPLSDL